MAKKNFFKATGKVAGTLAMVLALVFGLVLSGCDDGSGVKLTTDENGSLEGTWNCGSYQFVFAGSSYTFKVHSALMKTRKPLRLQRPMDGMVVVGPLLLDGVPIIIIL